MNRIPYALSATVARAKITRYLLDPQHPDNGGKAQLFASFEFDIANWQLLAAALAAHPVANAIFSKEINDYGTKYVVRCNLNSPDGRNPCLISVWMVDQDSTIPRFVTAYGT